MLTSGCMRFNSEGRVLIAIGTEPAFFNGGTPVDIDGNVIVSEGGPEVFLSGIGYRHIGTVCARDTSGISGYDSGLARDGVGGLALALAGPIVGYVAGIPVVDDGRVAVAFGTPPPARRGFSSGFDHGFG